MPTLLASYDGSPMECLGLLCLESGRGPRRVHEEAGGSMVGDRTETMSHSVI